tara:strand:+ start:81 stop:479 length:399 start_codon:yes stop_codon:yes gene_type:complete
MGATIKFRDKHDIYIRIILVITLSVYILGGLEKLFTFNSTVDSISKKLGTLKFLAYPAIIFAILVEIIPPILILVEPTNSLMAQISSFILVLFMVLVILMYHNPLTMKDQNAAFMVRVSMIGTLLLIAYNAE